MSKYAVYHVYEYDTSDCQGPFFEYDLICVFDSEDEAKEFKAKYEKPHISHKYEISYCPKKLNCGKIEIRELPTSYDEKDFWWLFE